LLSPFLVWRVFFISVLFTLGALAIFFNALGRGLDVATARTMVVNALVVFEIFYLFNVRYLHMTSLTLRGALGTLPVLVALLVVVAAQLAFTYLPLMQQWFDTRALGLLDCLLILAAGVLFILILEVEKLVIRHFDMFRGPDK
jgi:magnesium-transporting ATPase (P-type)